MRFARWTSTAVAAAILAANFAAVAEAQSIVCVDLEARLIQLDRNAGGGRIANVRQYDAPIAQQRNEIDRAMAEARRAACTGGFFLFQRTPEAKCGKLMATIKQMQGNLQRLMAARGQDGNDPYTLARERNDVLRQLSMNRCGPTYASNDQQQGGGLFESLFGTARFRTFGEGTYTEGMDLGTYRTLCVRTCDGFYFPISFSTVPGQFNTDAETCAAMCPGAEAVLYTHRNPGEDTGQMVSLAGEPYASLPAAFRFRQEYDKSCTCRSATTASLDGAFTDFTGNGSIEPMEVAPVAVAVPLPHVRPPAGEDPETAANRAGALVPGPVTKMEQTDVAGVSASGQRKIRVVGPAYFYGQ
jgi:hypothetical protein